MEDNVVKKVIVEEMNAAPIVEENEQSEDIFG